MSKENPLHPALRPLFEAFQTIAEKNSYREFDAAVYAQLEKTDEEPELAYFFEHALHNASYCGSDPTQFLCDGAAVACTELAKEAVITHLHRHPEAALQTPTLAIRADREHKLSIETDLKIPSVKEIPDQIWIELLLNLTREPIAA